MDEISSAMFGTLRRTTPVSRQFGFDRGRPIDRHYIEQFLRHHQSDIRGSVLEVGDDRYTAAFGDGKVTSSAVLDISPANSKANVIADLEKPEMVPLARFDCIIVTQTLQYLYDLRAGVESLHRMLRPGGVTLASFPGVSRTNDCDWGDRWYWNLTSRSACRLFAEVFPPDSVVVTGHGNVLVCAASLFGLADWELESSELGVYDPGFEVVITVRAVSKQTHACECIA
jgi:hypothetical protein